MKKRGVQAHVVSHVLYVNPFQTKNILRSFPKCVKSLSSKASLRLKLLKRGATFPLTALAMWLVCGHRGERELDGDQIFQIPSHVVHYSIPPSKKKHDAARTSSQGFYSLTNTQSTHVAIFVHCDYMLTNHLHDDKHLCRCIYEIWTVFLSFFSVGNPAFVSRSPLWGCHFLWEFYDLCFSQITRRCSTRSKISFHLFYFDLPLQSHTDPRNNTDTLCH